MEYISSDTNIWLDFAVIDRLDLPFRLPYIYLMDNDAIDDELLNPPDISDRLVEMGLQRTDCIALAIAKVRGITLLTGDGPLRKAAKAEGVQVMGTIGVLDQLSEGRYIDLAEFMYCIDELLKHNGKKVRLPEKELRKRLEKCCCTLP